MNLTPYSNMSSAELGKGPRTLTELSLFSGYCGLTLGLKLAGVPIWTIGYVDHESYIQKLIVQRIKDGLLDAAPIFGDICAFLHEGYARSYQGLVDILTAGFPCQPHSSAGRRLGASDPRNLWPELAECIGLVRPRSVLLENVPGLIDGASPYVATVLGDLARIGYDARWGLVPAAAVGAPHLRWRWWCLAYATDDGCSVRGRPAEQASEHKALGGREQPWADGAPGAVADARGERRQQDPRGASGDEGRDEGWLSEESDQLASPGQTVPDSAGEQVGTAGQPREHGGVGNTDGAGQQVIQRRSTDAEAPGNGTAYPAGWWDIEPPLDRVVDGAPHRVGQLRALGNGVVPAVVAEFLRRTREALR